MKRMLRQLLAEGRIEAVARLAEERAGVLGALVPLTYEADEELAWRAVEAMGATAARVAERNPAAALEHLRRLLWLLSEESGGICWRAPESMAEIVRRQPEAFADYIPIIVHLLVELAEEDLAHFRPGVLWAIGRLGPLASDEVAAVLPAVRTALAHPDPQVRGMAVWALVECGQSDVVTAIEPLSLDSGPVDLFEQGRLVRTTVGALAARAGPGWRARVRRQG